MAGGTPSAGVSRLPYLPGLDGLRAIAVVAVMIFHANHDWLKGGYLGVEVFFVISGYLITLLLIGEYERNGDVNLGQFWKRRFRRLLPALYVVLVGVAVYVTAFYTSRREEVRGDLVAAITYVSNWYQIIVGQGYGVAENFVPFRHLWSLAVEEQFYLLWPLVMLVLLRRSRGRGLPATGLKLMLGSVTIAIVVAYVYVPDATAGTCDVEGFKNGWATVAGKCFNVNEMLYLGSFSRAGGLLLGAGFAMLWRPMAIARGPLRNRQRTLDGAAAVGMAVLLAMMWTVWLFERQVYNPMLFRGGFLLTGVATLLVIAAATHPDSITGALLGNRVMLWIGTRSYGLYLFHWPVYQIIRKQANIDLTVAELLLALAITVPITEISYRFIESPIRHGALAGAFTRLRRDPHRLFAGIGVVILILAASFSLYKAKPQCVGDVQQSLCEASAGTNPTVPTTPGSTVPGDTTPSTTGTGPTEGTVALQAYPYVAIGESVMAGADDELKASGMWVDVAESRSPEGVRTIIVGLRRGGIIGEGTNVVIQVGTNNPMGADEIAAIMAEIPDNAGAVAFVTLYAPPVWIPANNDLIRSLPTTYPNVLVVDWAAHAGDAALCPDGIHLSCGDRSAAVLYTNLILAAFGLPLIENSQ